ncbi:unnamed protein product [Cylicocyclus nassatus]|uniref:Store-operated calcium entry-associated regulatory factor n=1 Tax=Cylicocyclus nassatus TaxID=53992 RepID=A0AA36HDU2_CYLNA|nr:unnamed protein product [Cylicocyclus nassatus]
MSLVYRLLVFVVLLFYLGQGECGANDRVLLRDVSTITLRDGQYTTGRREAPVPQIKCVGGKAKGEYRPRTVQCTKQGFDGVDYQWKCVADMPHEFEFGQVTVTCEGYSYPEDPYILKGSCGLEYDLEYSNTAYAKKDVSRSRKSGWSSWFTQENFANAIVAAFILYVIYAMFFANNTPQGPRAPPRYGWFGSGYDGGPGYPGGGHPPPSAPPPPPSYDDAMGFKSRPTGSASTSSGPGFWTGAGLGALGGYLFGRRGGTSPTSSAFGYSQPYRNERFMRDTGFDDSRADQPSTSQMHESTGYGGTRRR